MSQLLPHDPCICGLCAAEGPTCCQVTPGEVEVCFPLSPLEMDRIRDVVEGEGWFAQAPNTEAFRTKLFQLFPRDRAVLDNLFPSTKFHYRFAVRPNGDCHFLGSGGCVLPREARPYYCRLSPVWMRHGEFSRIAQTGCKAVDESRNVATLMQAVDLTPARARDLFGKLRLAWGLSPQEGGDPVPPALARTNKHNESS